MDSSSSSQVAHLCPGELRVPSHNHSSSRPIMSSNCRFLPILGKLRVPFRSRSNRRSHP